MTIEQQTRNALESFQRDYRCEFDDDNRLIDLNDDLVWILELKRDYNALLDFSNADEFVELINDERINRLFIALAISNVDWYSLTIQRVGDEIEIRSKRNDENDLTKIVNAYRNFDQLTILEIVDNYVLIL